MTTDNTPLNADDGLREQILYEAEVTYAPFTRENYRTEEIVKLPLKTLLKLILADRKKHELEARYNEISHVFSVEEPHTDIHGKHPHVITVRERKDELKQELEKL